MPSSSSRLIAFARTAWSRRSDGGRPSREEANPPQRPGEVPTMTFSTTLNPCHRPTLWRVRAMPRARNRDGRGLIDSPRYSR